MWTRILVAKNLSQTRFLRRNITPFLDNWLLDLSWVGSGSGTDFLGHINTLLSWGQLWNKLGDMLASSLGLKRTLFLGGILDNSLGFVITLLSSLLESTTSWGTELSWFLGTSSDWGVLLDILFGNTADLLWPLGALGVGSISRSLILTLFLNLSFTSNNIILNIMNFLLGPALRLIFSSTDLRTLNITILDKRGSTDLDSFIESNCFIFNETALSEVFLTLLLLLRLIVCHIGGVTPLVITVVTLDNIIIFSFLNHLNLVNTSLSIRSWGSSSNISKAWGTTFSSLTLSSLSKRSRCTTGISMISMITMVMVSMMMLITVGIEWEGVDQRFSISDLSSQLPCSKDTLSTNHNKEQKLWIHFFNLSLQVLLHEHCSTLTPH